MLYKSTRGESGIRSTDALIRGIAKDGGLFLPEQFPILKLGDLKDKNYKDLALSILSNYLDLEENYLKDSIENAYNTFEHEKICPIYNTSEFSYLELFHGKTLAFKDIALSILPYFITGALREEKIKEKVCILTATSGDTGSAAISGFANVEDVKINVLFPTRGISEVQKLQMTTVDSKNVNATAINGNFDDAQKKVKEIFASADIKEEVLEKGYLLSSANSINIGRLLPQVVYYFHAYFELVRKGDIHLGDKIDVCVPTGNFGNIMASYIAKEMGVPIEYFVVASNDNNILSDFFNTGIYDTDRDFKVTTSPSMDILVSSNLERLIYIKSGEKNTIDAMKKLKDTGEFNIDKSLFNEFYAGYADENQVESEIREVYQREGYLIDPHTAVASYVARNFRENTKSNNKMIIASTASVFKFPKIICKALDIEISGLDEFDMIDMISKKTNMPIPNVFNYIKNAEEVHKDVIDISEVVGNIMSKL